MKRVVCGCLLMTVAILAGQRPAAALCLYQPEAKAIWVYDYPRSMPCTLKQLLAADKMFEWGLVTYDLTNDTYTVAANLKIGSNDGSDTFFQIGSREHPRETLIMKGNLVLFPGTITGRTRESQLGVNRLTIGLADDDAVRASLKIYNEPGQFHTILAGSYYQGSDHPSPIAVYGGQLCVYNGTITAAIQDKQHAIGAAGGRHMYLPGRVVLRNATISWVAGVIAFGMNAAYSEVVNSVFENSGYALINQEQAATNCVFRNLGIAVRDWGGPLDALLTDCTFENNDANWSLSRGRLRCVDCVFGPPRKGNSYKSGPQQKEGKAPYAYFRSSRHVIVEVKDAAGKPIKGARVEITTPQDALFRHIASTGTNGRSAGRGSGNALLLTEREETATAIPDQPRVTEYRYALSISASNYAPATIAALKPQESWKIIPVVLEKKP